MAEQILLAFGHDLDVSVLNSALFQALQDIFGEVHVHNSGIPASLTIPPRSIKQDEFNIYIPSLHNYKRGSVIVLNPSRWGECYSVNCPLCGDTRHRLWFCHLWGTPVKIQGSSRKYRVNTSCCICYNENCTSIHFDMWAGYIESIKEKLNEYLNDSKGITLDTKLETLRAGADGRVQITKELNPKQIPHGLLPLEFLKQKESLFQYITTRKWSLDLLEKFKCKFCPKNSVIYIPKNDEWVERHIMYDSLFIPFFDYAGRLFSWQLRVLSDDIPKKTWPKYYHMPHTNFDNYLYTEELAWTRPYPIIVEGVTDVWRISEVDPENFVGLALLGKTLSKGKLDVIKTWWDNAKASCLIMLDSPSEDSSVIKHRKILVQQISALNIFEKVIVIDLPTGDPGSYAIDDLRQILKSKMDLL